MCFPLHDHMISFPALSLVGKCVEMDLSDISLICETVMSNISLLLHVMLLRTIKSICTGCEEKHHDAFLKKHFETSIFV